MPRHVAFLRAINVGGHTVTMERLRAVFEAQGFANVETFIASGNVVFDTRAAAGPKLEARIGAALRQALGYEVATFLRSPAEVAAIAAHEPFERPGAALNVAFVHQLPDAAAKRRVLALRTELDDFIVRGREIWWRCAVRQSESKRSNAAIEKALGAPSTVRGVNTVRKLAAKLGA